MAADKKGYIIVNEIRYIYTVRQRRYVIKVIVYSQNQKKPFFTVYFSYVEYWGFDVYRPKTIEILIKFYTANSHKLSKNEFYVLEQPLLFRSLFECYFSNSNNTERARFLEWCMMQKY